MRLTQGFDLNDDVVAVGGRVVLDLMSSINPPG